MESQKKIKELCDAYDTSEYGKKNFQAAQANQPVALEISEETTTSNIKLKRSPYKASWCAQFSAVLWRSWISVVREAKAFRVKTMTTIVKTRKLQN